MHSDELRIAIAKACGWRIYVSNGFTYYERPGGNVLNRGLCISFLPDYLSDLNAMHEAESILTENQQYKFIYHLCGNSQEQESTIEWCDIHVTAAQRAEAFLRTLNLWED